MPTFHKRVENNTIHIQVEVSVAQGQQGHRFVALVDTGANTTAVTSRVVNLTQTELARRLDRAQASVSAMETAADNLVSTLRMAVEGMGGHLEVTAVFDNERIPLTTPMRPEGEEGDGGAAAAQDAAEESAPQLERISRVNPQRPTDRREAIAAAKRTVTAARRRQKAAG